MCDSFEPNYASSASSGALEEASDDSPRRQAWVKVIQAPSPGMGARTDERQIVEPCLLPLRGSFIHLPYPTADAVGLEFGHSACIGSH